jgi:lipoprotein-releasing system permease protein
MLQAGNRPAFPFIRGIDVHAEKQVIPLEKFLQRGTTEDLDDDSVFLSSSLAMTVLAGVGDTVDLYTPLMLEKLKADEVLLPRSVRVAGIYETGWNQFDSSTMICTLRTMQDLYGLGDAVHGLAVRLNDGVDELRFTDKLNDGLLIPPLFARAWLEINQDFLWVLALEKNILLLLMLFIVVVAAFAIAIAQLLTVLRKTREIGLLGAIGGRPFELAMSYCFQGFFIGLLGVTLGLGLAFTVLHYRDGIVGFLANLTQTKEMLVRFYQFAHLPVHYAREDFVVVITATLLLSTLAGLVPALRAARMKPAEALRAD